MQMLRLLISQYIMLKLIQFTATTFHMKICKQHQPLDQVTELRQELQDKYHRIIRW